MAAYDMVHPANMLLHVGMMSFVGGFVGFTSYKRDMPDLEDESLEGKVATDKFCNDLIDASKEFTRSQH